jgi:hypothetical protein
MKRTVFAVALAVVAAGVGSVACSGSSSGGGGNSAANAAACAALAKSVCGELQMCNPYVLDGDYGDEPTCETRQVLNCTNALAAPSTGATASSENACAMADMSLSCSDDLNHVTPAPCNVQPGTAANQSACAFSGQCQSAFCAISPGAACGVCATPPMPGSSCANLTTCGTGLVCSGGLCEAYVASGGACGKNAPCGAGLSCVGETATAMGKCMTAGNTVGATCDPLLKTGGGCDRDLGLTCNTVTKKCATIVKAMPGQNCGNNVGTKTAGYQIVECGGGGAATCAQNKCVQVAGDGQACDTVAGPDCMAPARCIGMAAGDAGGTTGMCGVPDGTKCH